MILSHRMYLNRRSLSLMQNNGVRFSQDDPPPGGPGIDAGAESPLEVAPPVEAAEKDNLPQDVAADAPADTAAGEGGPAKDWKAEYVREAAQSRKYRQRAQKAETELEQLRPLALGPAQHEEYQRLRLAAADAAAKDQRISRLEAMVRQVSGLNELNKALAGCGVGRGCPNGEKMLAQASALLAGRIRVELDGDVPAVRVLDEAGAVMLDPAGAGPMGVRPFVADWLAQEGCHFLPPSGDTGSGAHGGFAVAPAIDIQALDRDPRAKAEFIARHGPTAYLQLAQRRQQ